MKQSQDIGLKKLPVINDVQELIILNMKYDDQQIHH